MHVVTTEALQLGPLNREASPCLRPAQSVHARNSAGEAHEATGNAGQAIEMDPLQLSKFRKKIEPMDTDANDSILAAACFKHPDIKAMVDQWLKAKIQRESQRVIDFDWYSKSVWKDLNITYRKLSGSKQFDKPFEVFEDICESINYIRKQCTGIASPQTRFNGLLVLRKIGKAITLSGDTLGPEVRKQFGNSSGRMTPLKCRVFDRREDVTR